MEDATPLVIGFPHIAVCVADIDAATRFYVDGLGFKCGDGGHPPGIDKLIGVPNAQVRTRFVSHPGGATLELWTTENLPVNGSTTPTPAALRGRTNLCLIVSDLDAAAQRIVAFGGQQLEESLINTGFARIMFCCDLDGMRIELVEMQADWPGYYTAEGE